MTATRCLMVPPWWTWRTASPYNSRCCRSWPHRASTCGWAVRQRVSISVVKGMVDWKLTNTWSPAESCIKRC